MSDTALTKGAHHPGLTVPDLAKTRAVFVDTPGFAQTKPFTLEGDTLEVNVDASDGEFAVEVLDADGSPIPSFTLDAADRYEGTDDLRLQPRWREHDDLHALKGRTVRLKFHLRNAGIYAFQITSES